jgi:hypothetical protein
MHKIKRISARNYSCKNYYIVYIPEEKLWYVGINTDSGSSHLEDFTKYRNARVYVLDQVNQEAK